MSTSWHLLLQYDTSTSWQLPLEHDTSASWHLPCSMTCQLVDNFHWNMTHQLVDTYPCNTTHPCPDSCQPGCLGRLGWRGPSVCQDTAYRTRCRKPECLLCCTSPCDLCFDICWFECKKKVKQAVTTTRWRSYQASGFDLWNKRLVS